MQKDCLDLLFGRQDNYAPPKGKIFVGTGDYTEIGNEFLQYFIEVGGLKPNAKVLDAGWVLVEWYNITIQLKHSKIYKRKK